METNNKTEREDGNKSAAVGFFHSYRGQYIIGQALFVAIEAMEKVEPAVRREVSNIADMRFLMETLFPMYSMVSGALTESQEELSEMIDRANIDSPDSTDGCPDCEGEGMPLPVDADLERYSKCGNCKGWLPLEEEA